MGVTSSAQCRNNRRHHRCEQTVYMSMHNAWCDAQRDRLLLLVIIIRYLLSNGDRAILCWRGRGGCSMFLLTRVRSARRSFW